LKLEIEIRRYERMRERKVGKIVLAIGMATLMVLMVFTLIGGNASAAPTTIHVDDDNTTGIEDGSMANPYNTIQEGVDAANSGDTVYVNSGSYTENVVIGKSVTLQGEDSATTTLDAIDEYSNVFSLRADNIKVSGFTVSSGDIGFEVFYANYCEISDNVVVSNNDGIFIRHET
jgi:nitrous oxidase accessory protein NosD